MDVAVLGGSETDECLDMAEELGRLLKQWGHFVHTFGFGHAAIAVSRGAFSVKERLLDNYPSDRPPPYEFSCLAWESCSYPHRLDTLIKEPSAYVYLPGSSMAELLTVLRVQADQRDRCPMSHIKPVVLLSVRGGEACSVLDWLHQVKEMNITGLIQHVSTPQKAVELITPAPFAA